ncbi:acyl-CoA synthetase [Nocardia aurantia]|uniref:Long-chain-fatty-acid--CoA ligase n=1 Tax=Nocardia aurantia TaxID=2585199 RepID=A0A7K0DTW5_9NOCA|nr:acyl-CoA synthetase [Nocardia aurantia]MQY29201.1 Long-chain-fatty-acid--CoA ligase [Nocardia aurantia]
MLCPATYAAATPDRPAAVLADTGEVLTYAELEDRSIRLAGALRAAGLRPGDVLALLTENTLRAFEVYWAALRSGLYLTAINRSLTADEAAYIVGDSGAAAIVVSGATPEIASVAATLVDRTPSLRLRLAYDGEVAGHESYERTLAAASPVRPADEPHGVPMLYSSGTTGFPKGVRPDLPPYRLGDPRGEPMVGLLRRYFGIGTDTVYLSPAPLYHAAPLRWSGSVQALGGTVVVMRRFDAEAALRAIERWRVTHGQFVPTMLVRMLRLPAEIRAAHDVSSLRCAVHAAAPCPVEVKQRMIDWWGPVLYEYYSNTEGNCMTMVDSATWLERPGTVGRPILGVLHICDDDGRELPARHIGTVYGDRPDHHVVYHNDPEKSAAARHPERPTWTTAGDVGFVDEDGYLYLTDRKSFTIISGGVNIYPQEVENALVLHPAIFDVAVIGLPDEAMGESVTAFVQPAAGTEPGPELAAQIIEFTRGRIAHYKAPRAVHFVDSLPRTETGKLLKRELRARYVTER